MNTQRMDPNAAHSNVEQRMRTVRILWLGLVVSIGVYFAFTLFAGRSENVEPSSMLSLALLVAGVSTTLLSFPIKNRLIARAVEQQQVQQVQSGYIVAWAMCEVPALLGMLDYFAAAHPHYYILFLIAACGELLHFPRREHFINASFSRPIDS